MTVHFGGLLRTPLSASPRQAACPGYGSGNLAGTQQSDGAEVLAYGIEIPGAEQDGFLGEMNPLPDLDRPTGLAFGPLGTRWLPTFKAFRDHKSRFGVSGLICRACRETNLAAAVIDSGAAPQWGGDTPALHSLPVPTPFFLGGDGGRVLRHV